MTVNVFLKFFYLALIYKKNSIAIKFPRVVVANTLMEIVKYEEKKNSNDTIDNIIHSNRK